jgi:hypothetical protein
MATLPKKLSQWIEEAHPNLAPEGYEVRSIKTWRYNCIAFAADDVSDWWWPDPDEDTDAYWPISWREESIDCFIKAYQSIGYEVCGNEAENGFEKIAIFALNDVPTHAAKQLKDGRWKSKIGPDEDIYHNTLRALEDDNNYGKVVRYMKRPIK